MSCQRSVVVSVVLAIGVVIGMAVTGGQAGAAGRVVQVRTSAELSAALAAALPGDEIRLADGTYPGRFRLTADGTATAPITLVGSRAAVLDGQATSTGRVVQLEGDHWRLVGFTVTNGQKGIMALGAHHTTIDSVRVHRIGDEAIHFRDGSSDNLVVGSLVSDTGLRSPGYGEGLYFGQAVSNWVGGQPDRSDRNRAIGNHFGPNVRAEAIDVKEGTTGGEIRDNTFDGTGMSGTNYADSWVDVKGNGYRVVGNRGAKALRHGFETHVAVEGWGRGNVFSANVADVQGPGYGFSVTAGNTVCDDNTVTNAGSGVANVALTRCSG